MSRLTPGGIGTITTSIDTTGLATSANQTTLIGHVDGIEALLAGTLAVSNAGLTELAAAINVSSQMDVNIAANGIGLATAAHQVTQNGYLDGLETLITSTNTKLDTVNTNLGTIDTRVDGIEGLIGTTNTNTGNSATSLGIMDDWDNGASDGASVSGDVAHDTADAGEPVKVGGKATDVGATITAVSNNDRVNASFLRNGVQLVLGGETNIITKNLNVTDADGAQTDTAIITVSAGTAIVVTMVQVYVDSATTATGGVAVRIGFGTANTPAADSAGIIFAHPGISAGSGSVVGNGGGIIGMGASNEDLRLTCEDPAGGNLDIIVTYFTIAIG